MTSIVSHPNWAFCRHDACILAANKTKTNQRDELRWVKWGRKLMFFSLRSMVFQGFLAVAENYADTNWAWYSFVCFFLRFVFNIDFSYLNNALFMNPSSLRSKSFFYKTSVILSSNKKMFPLSKRNFDMKFLFFKFIPHWRGTGNFNEMKNCCRDFRKITF